MNKHIKTNLFSKKAPAGQIKAQGFAPAAASHPSVLGPVCRDYFLAKKLYVICVGDLVAHQFGDESRDSRPEGNRRVLPGVLMTSFIKQDDHRILPVCRVSAASASTISRINHRTSSNIGLFGQVTVSDGPK